MEEAGAEKGARKSGNAGAFRRASRYAISPFQIRAGRVIIGYDTQAKEKVK